MVYDDSRKDLIVVGRIDPARPRVTLDELVVALRAILKQHNWPEVSIDIDEQTSRTGKQKVRFGGGLAGTSVGKAMLDADVVLKELALGYRSAEIWGIRSFFDMFCEYAAVIRRSRPSQPFLVRRR